MKRSQFSTAAGIPLPPNRPTALRRRRRGIALLLVLLVVAMTLALSYAMIRSQYTALQIQRNGTLRVHARQAALSGLSVAIKKMHTSGWAGVNTTLTESLGNYESFDVTYTAGDASLGPGHPEYQNLPYRVTVLATGYAADGENPQCSATHQIRAVVRLVPRALGQQPTDWAAMQQYTVYQTNAEPFELDIPCRIEGRVRVQGKLKTALHYPTDDAARSRYLSDLNAMRLAGQPDYRPFNGPVDLPFSEQAPGQVLRLTNELAVTANDTLVKQAAADWTIPTGLTSYQIYDGGPVYTIPAVSGTLENTTLEPDALANPLGIYYRDGSVTIRNGVTIRGTLFCKYDVRVEGTNVHFQPVELPALYGSASPVRLPAASCQNFTVTATAGGSLTGLLAVFGKFEIEKSPETVEFAITGRVVTRDFYIWERQPWDTLDWSAYYLAFQKQLGGNPAVAYFPVWMGNQGRDPRPRLTVKPDLPPVSYHWKKPNDPVYVPHPDDDALRWDLCEWTDNP